MKINISLVLLAFCMLSTLRGMSQGQMQFKSQSQGKDSLVVVEFLNTDSYRSVTKDSATTLTLLVGNVRLKQDNTLIYCDSMVSNGKDNIIESFGHVHINDDSTNIYSDYMKYRVDNKTVIFQKNVKMTDGKGVLTTEELQYDLKSKVGVYNNGGKIVNNGSVLTSKEGTYYGETKDVLFKKNVVLRDPQYDLSADSLLYNTETQRSTFITETFILFKDSTRRTVTTSNGYYDLKSRKAVFGNRPIITDGSQQITGDDVNIDDSLGISTAIGHAVYKDTAQGISIRANYMINNKKNSSFLATDKPLMILKQDKDSIYITADTLFSARLIDAPWTIRKISTADSLHKHYVDSLYSEQADSNHQAALGDLSGTDSLKAGGRDSTRQLFHDESHQIIHDSTVDQALLDTLHHININSPLYQRQEKDSLLASKGADSLKAIIVRNHAGADSLKNLIAKNLPGADSLKTRIAAAAQSRGAGNPGAPGAQKPREAFHFQDRQQVSRRRGEPSIDTATGPLSAADSNLRYIQGFHHVRIFSDSLQAVSDSLFYSGKDSIFRLFKNPIAWGSGHYQVTGDTMYVYTKNKKASRLYVFENALTINKVGTNFFNQIKGTTINCYFKGGEVDYMRAKGNAESIYYMQDDNKAYTGVNKAHADIIDMIFDQKEKDKGRELNRVVLRSDAEGTMTPMRKVNFDDMRLRGFKWQEDKRPKSKYDLFE